MEDNPFRQGIAVLPREMRIAALQMTEEEQKRCEELHLRAGRPLSWSDCQGEHDITLGGETLLVSRDDLRLVLELATEASFHTALEKLCRGFLPLKGGHRLGVCGTGVLRDGEMWNIRDISSVAIRIAREQKGAASGILPGLFHEGSMHSALILSPPGRGKTTLLRDLIRGISNGEGGQPLRVGLADERGEIAAMSHGLPQLDIGAHTDVMDGCPKSTAMLSLIRSMNPQVLAADEITSPADIDAISVAANCGISILATAHGGSAADLRLKPLYRRLLEQHIFRYLILIDVADGKRSYRTEALR